MQFQGYHVAKCLPIHYVDLPQCVVSKFITVCSLSKLEKQQQRKEKTRAKGPSESSKERSAPRKEDRSASSGAEGDVSSEREP
ncbi:D-tyrosyl-tRNA(Tyr) deacylase 1-like protein [Cricetulus griseus]|nr:D-tyrosyl-tRNA(Tyr) deacylase 1-like protein [Cricetulus griseus]